MLPDLIEVWPSHLVYPLHSQWLKENRDRFHKVIIVFTNMNAGTGDYRNHIQQELRNSHVTFLDCLPAKAEEDWRNKAVNMGLSVSNAERVWFIEQDFMPLEGFWKIIDKVETACVVGVEIQGRLHPCCLLVKRDAIEQTSKDFSARPDEGYDHFGLFQKELEELFPVFLIRPEFWYHMNGLSQNLYLLQKGEVPNYNPEEFKAYCRDCLKADELPLQFKHLFEDYLYEPKL